MQVITNVYQTLRFVQSLPKRERQPLANKFRNAEAEGMLDIQSVVFIY